MEKRKIAFYLIFLFSFLFFIFNLAPTVTYGDSAEFVIGAYKLTIVHPSGYPLYLLLGKLFTFIPIGDIAYRVNLMSAFFGALTSSMVFLILSELTQSLLISFISTFTLTFSLTFSYLSTIAEVYTLNAFFVALLIYILLQWNKKGEKKLLFLFSFILGLSLTNHLTILLFLPSFLIYFFLNSSKAYLRSMDLAKMIFLFLLGLLPYLYIPIVSSSSSEIIFWPKIRSFKEFILFVSGSHFKVWLLNRSIKEFINSISKFISFLLIQFPGLATVFGVIGFWRNKKEYKKEFILLFLMFFVLFLFGINYRIEDIHHFYLPCYLIFSIWIGFGILWLWKRTPQQKKYRILFISTIFLLFLSYKLTYETLGIPMQIEKSCYFSDTSRMGLLSTEKNSVIICDWAYATLFRYWQMVYGIRKDVKIVFDYDENWIEYVERLYGKKKLYLTKHNQWVSAKYYLIPYSFIYKVEKTRPEFKESDSTPQSFTNISFFDEILLLGYDIIEEIKEKRILVLKLYWKALKEPKETYDVEIKVLDCKRKVIYFKDFRPVYGHYSTAKWKEGEILTEKLELYLPSKKFPLLIDLTLYNMEKKKSCKRSLNIPL